MDYENDINVDGKIVASENIIATAKEVEIATGSTTLEDVIVDWSKANTYVLDLTSMNLNAGSITADIIFANGNPGDVKNKLIVIQPTTNIVEFGFNFVFQNDEGDSVTYVIENHLEILDRINVLGSTNVIEFSYFGNIYKEFGNYSESTDYDSTAIVNTGDSYETSISKLDAALSSLTRSAKPISDDSTELLNFEGTDFVNGWISLETGNPLLDVIFDNPTFQILEFATEDIQEVRLRIDNVIVATISNTSFSDNLPETLSDNALVLTKYEFSVSDTAYEALMAFTGGNELSSKGDDYVLTLSTGNETSKDFKFKKYDEPTLSGNPNVDSISIEEINVSDYVSGLPVLTEGSSVQISATYNNISYEDGGKGCYGSTVGKITSDLANEVLVPSVDNAAMLSSAPNSPLISSSLIINDNVFSLNAEFDAYNHVAESSFTAASSANIFNANPIIVDSITDKTLFGIDHTSSLLNTSSLMILGGVVQYPSGDFSTTWTGTAQIGSRDYNSISDDRYIELNVSMSEDSRIGLNFSDQLGFSNTGLEQSDLFDIKIYRDDMPSEVYEGSIAYEGFGVVSNGDGALDVAASSMEQKILTFGEPFSGIATVRIILKSGSQHEFSQDVSLTALK